MQDEIFHSRIQMGFKVHYERGNHLLLAALEDVQLEETLSPVQTTNDDTLVLAELDQLGIV